MRPLITDAAIAGGGTDIAEGGCAADTRMPRLRFEDNLSRLRRQHHGECIFNSQLSWLPDIAVTFDDDGVLHGYFSCTGAHQGYRGRVHGGLIAAVIDASMAQCMMGHGAVGYTADLAVKYRHPLLIGVAATFVTRIVNINVGMLFTLNCEMVQQRKLVAEATGRFYKFA